MDNENNNNHGSRYGSTDYFLKSELGDNVYKFRPSYGENNNDYHKETTSERRKFSVNIPKNVNISGRVKIYSGLKDKVYKFCNSLTIKEKIKLAVLIASIIAIGTAVIVTSAPEKEAIVPEGYAKYTITIDGTNFLEKNKIEKEYLSKLEKKNDFSVDYDWGTHKATVPNLYSEDDELYKRMMDLKNSMDSAKYNYVEYNFTSGEDLYGVASKIVLYDWQINECVNMICSRNNINNKNIVDRGKIFVPTKDYFSYQDSYYKALEQFEESLKDGPKSVGHR